MREVAFAVVLLAAAVLVAAGAWQFHPGAGLIVGGTLLAGWSWQAFKPAEDDE